MRNMSKASKFYWLFLVTCAIIAGTCLMLPSRPSVASLPTAMGQVNTDLAKRVPHAPNATGTASPTPGGCALAWSFVASPNVSAQLNSLNSVAALSSSDAWAVGKYLNPSSNLQTLIEHWNGTNWSIVPSPNTGSDDFLMGVTALAANDVWAVGYYYDAGNNRTLIEHWNGSAWSIAPSPNGGSDNYLDAVTAVAANDVWAVGDYFSGTAEQTLTLHWNGTAWSIVSSPNVGTGTNHLYAAASTAANDVWAAGVTYDPASISHTLTLIMHWDGSVWTIISSPSPSANYNYLQGITAISANDAWAVGRNDLTSGTYRTLIEHWNGSAWSVVSSPNVGAESNYLNAVSARATDDVWAVGSASVSGQDQTLIERWNGTAWGIVTSASPTPCAGGTAHSSQFLGVFALPGSDAWAVGDFTIGFPTDTLAEHYSTACATPTPTCPPTTPSPTSPPACGVIVTSVDISCTAPNSISYTFHFNNTCSTTISAPGSWLGFQTAALPGGSWMLSQESFTDLSFPPGASSYGGHFDGVSGDARYYRIDFSSNPGGGGFGGSSPVGSVCGLVEPTACPIQFSDVPVGSTFYDFVRCLACRQVVSGYSDGTFRPNNSVTRGQLSKIVSNSAGFTESPGPQVFEDVAPGSTFYDWVNRLANRHYINGYTCGGAAEPCVPPGNRPYFRPNANVTRGQSAKIIATAANFGPPPPGQQTFEDVPEGSTFWAWIEPLAAFGAIGGYQCGGAGEPCVPPGMRPYFRVGANVTRGQSAKMVANTFYPYSHTP